MRTSDIVSGLLLLAVGVMTLLIIIPAEISGHSAYGIPPDFFPRFLVVLLIGFSILLVVSRSIAQLRSTPATESEELPLQRADWIFVTGAAIYLAAVFLVMKHVGFLAAGILAILVAAMAMGSLRQRPVRMVALSVLAPPAIFYAFKELFYVFLPS